MQDCTVNNKRIQWLNKSSINIPNISPFEFNQFFIGSVNYIKQNIGVTNTNPLELLQNYKIEPKYFNIGRK